MLDALRLAVGTLTAFRVRAPSAVDRTVAGRAAALAPIAAIPLGALVAFILWVASSLDLHPLAGGLLSVAVLALGTRAFHLDGLADTADGLTASYDRDRSLAVMKTGDVGPAGVVALIVVLGLQAVGFAGLADAPLLAGVLVCLSRGVLVLCCARGVPAARSDGLGNPFAGSVSRTVAAAAWLGSAVIGCMAVDAAGLSWTDAAVGFAVVTVVVALLVRRAVTRLGGVTGDIFGAAIEVSLALLLL